MTMQKHTFSGVTSASIVAALALLISTGCSDTPTPPRSDAAELASVYPQDRTERFEVRTATGQVEVMTIAQHSSGSTREIVLTRNGRPVLVMKEKWARSGSTWNRTGRSVSVPGIEVLASPISDAALNDVAVTQARQNAETVLSHISFAGQSDVLFSDGGCGGKALKVLAAGLTADAAVAAAVLAPTPLTVAAAVAAIAYAAEAYDEYIQCLKQAYL